LPQANFSISKLGLVGAGTMGSSIAVSLTQLELPIVLIDKDTAALEKGLLQIDKLFAGLERKSQTDGATNNEVILDLKKRRSLIKAASNFDDLANCDLIIEAASEDLEIKKAILENLDRACKSSTIFASNTSSFSITQLASFTTRPQQIIGMHFFNPGHIMKLVEIIAGINTDAKTLSTTLDLVTRLDKLPIKVEECASFLVNRLLGRYINEAIWILQLGLTDVQTIDKSAQQIFMPIGPLQLRDMNGLDIGLSVANFNYTEYGERFMPPPLLTLMMKEKFLGKKVGIGFYTYSENERKSNTINPQLNNLIQQSQKENHLQTSNLPAFEPIQLFLPMINEAFLVLQEKIVSPSDIDVALKAGLGMKEGLLEFAFRFGLNNCLSKIEELNKFYGERFRPAPLLKRYVWANKTTL
jgi:3-hydroxyacyl-CoA dehydrogenase